MASDRGASRNPRIANADEENRSLDAEREWKQSSVQLFYGGPRLSHPRPGVRRGNNSKVLAAAYPVVKPSPIASFFDVAQRDVHPPLCIAALHHRFRKGADCKHRH
jgi:hypothetical protein